MALPSLAWSALCSPERLHSLNPVLVAAMSAFSLWLLATAAHNGVAALTSGVKASVSSVAIKGLGGDCSGRSPRKGPLSTLVDLILAVTIAADLDGSQSI